MIVKAIGNGVFSVRACQRLADRSGQHLRFA
jgi:hypothetical protein